MIPVRGILRESFSQTREYEILDTEQTEHGEHSNPISDQLLDEHLQVSQKEF